MMKKILLTISALVLIIFEAKTQNVLTEDFDFAPIDSLENSGNWVRTGLNAKYNIKVVAPGLEYKDYSGSGKGNSCLIENYGDGDLLFKNFTTPITSGAAYLSFMVRVDSLPTTVTQGYCISLNPNDGGTNLNTALHIKRLSNNFFDFGVRKLSFIDFTNDSFELKKTYLIVLKYSFVPGDNNDSSSLYVFKSGVPVSEPITPMSSTIEGNDYGGQGSIHLNNNYAQSGLTGIKVHLDGLRVGNSWESSVLSKLSSVTDGSGVVNSKFTCYPNPSSGIMKLDYIIPSSGIVSIQILNSQGLVCANLLQADQEEGEYSISWNGDSMPDGFYTCRFQFHGITTYKKLLIIR